MMVLALSALLLTAAPGVSQPVAGPKVSTPRTALLDVSADVLQPSESQIGLFWGEYARGIVPGLQLSTHLAADLVTIVNLHAKFQFVSRPEIRASIEAGAYWAPLANVLLHGNGLAVPAAVRATLPLANNLDLSLAGTYQLWDLRLGEIAYDGHSFGSELNLVRYDRFGAWLLQGKLPLFTARSANVRIEGSPTPLVGSSILGDSNSWSVLLARDHIFGDSAHVRFGLGYRRTPGILVIESFGNILVQLGLYWR